MQRLSLSMPSKERPFGVRSIHLHAPRCSWSGGALRLLPWESCALASAHVAFDQMKVKYPSSKSDLRKSLNINGLSGTFMLRKACAEPLGQVKVKYRLSTNLRP